MGVMSCAITHLTAPNTRPSFSLQSMPAVPPPATVLVTGANGYVASWIVATLLQRGYCVIGALRSTSRGENVKACMEKLTGEKRPSQFQYYVVPDVTKVALTFYSVPALLI